jgi:hypothetical protein
LCPFISQSLRLSFVYSTPLHSYLLAGLVKLDFDK